LKVSNSLLLNETCRFKLELEEEQATMLDEILKLLKNGADMPR